MKLFYSFVSSLLARAYAGAKCPTRADYSVASCHYTLASTIKAKIFIPRGGLPEKERSRARPCRGDFLFLIFCFFFIKEKEEEKKKKRKRRRENNPKKHNTFIINKTIRKHTSRAQSHSPKIKIAPLKLNDSLL